MPVGTDSGWAESERSTPKRLLWASVVQGVGLIMVTSVVALVTLDPVSLSRYVLGVLLWVGITVLYVGMLQRSRLLAQLDASTAARIESIERPTRGAPAAPTLIAFAADQLYAAAERERLAVSRAERRLNSLYQIGTLLVLLSVLVPFVLVYLYVTSDPILRLQRLRGLGVDPKTLAEVSQRDWHLLVAGVSFGLLFLAAARGILNSESRQRDAYRAAAERETYYGDLSRALRIADRLAEDEHEYAEQVRNPAVRRVIDRLLERAPREGSPTKVASDGDGTEASLLPEHVKALAAIFSRPSKA